LLAQRASESDQILFRTITLDLTAAKAGRDSARAELRAAHAKEAAKVTPALSAADFDLNHDGKLDNAEMAAWIAAVRAAAQQSPSFMQRFDRNHDGRLDDAEWAVAGKEIFGGH
jgi:hypothetical protein